MSFVFKNYSFDDKELVAVFSYQNNGINFTEKYNFRDGIKNYNKKVLDQALFLAFVLIGTSYYKTYPSKEVIFESHKIDKYQAGFFTKVYQEGMSQFAYENNLTRGDLAVFSSTIDSNNTSVEYKSTDSNPLVLQSGGKDSLLLASLLEKSKNDFSPWFITYSNYYPVVLDEFKNQLLLVDRLIDKDNIKKAVDSGGLNGHVPITYIVFSVAIVQAVLSGKSRVLAAVGHEGEEPYALIDDLPVAHQWAKTWNAEQSFAQYVNRYISNSIKIGSPLRRFSELKIAELFVKNDWSKYSTKFSSCNLGNYSQGHDNTKLGWCGNCAKCANSFLLFAPFIEPTELINIFNSENLFKKANLIDIFKGLLGVDNTEKPFECIGEEAELRCAYHMANKKYKEYSLPFDVPKSNFDYQKEYVYQEWTDQFLLQ